MLSTSFKESAFIPDHEYHRLTYSVPENLTIKAYDYDTIVEGSGYSERFP